MLQNTGKFAGRTVMINGASRGIGREIALKLAKDKANIIIGAKTAKEHSKLPGTIYTVAKEIEEAGGRALPCIMDVQDENQVASAIEQGVKEFGGIDIVINNASAIILTKTLETDMKKYDLMHKIIARGSFLVQVQVSEIKSKICIPYLKNGENPHILNITPPINLNSKWFPGNLAYTLAKYNASMLTLGLSEEFREDGIAVNSLWPKFVAFTAAMVMLGGGKEVKPQCRKPEIMADAAYAVLSRDSTKYTGNFALDEEILKEEGIKDFDQYAFDPKTKLMSDLYIDEKCNTSVHAKQYGISSVT